MTRLLRGRQVVALVAAAVSASLPWLAVASRSYTAAVVPSKAYQGSAFGIAVHGLSPGETVTAELYESSGEVALDTATATQPADADEANVLQLDLPAGAAAQYRVELASTDMSLDGSHTVQGLVAADAALILEADRPMYKPGATIRVRLLFVDSDFKPKASESFQLLAKDPNNFVLQKWEEATDAFGVFEAELPTSTGAALGAWRFEAEAADGSVSAVKTVTLEEYVLPTFEVGLSTVTSHIVQPGQPGDVSIAGAIVPTYTYGEPVQGKATVTVYQKPGVIICLGCLPIMGGAAPMMVAEVAEESSDKSGEEYLLLATLEVDVDGETSFEVMISSANINFRGEALVLEVSVKDAVTSEEQSTSTSLPVAWSSTMVAMQSPNVFVPGGTYTVKVSAVMADGTPMTGSYNLTGSIMDNTYSTAHTIPATEISVTDGEGTLEVALPDEDEECCGVEDDTCCHSTMELQLVDAEGLSVAQKSVSAIQSPSNSMITVKPSGDAGSSFTVQRTASLASEGLFWALLTAAGGVVQAGVLASGSSTITIEVTAALVNGGVLLVHSTVGEELVAGSAVVSATSTGVLPMEVTAEFRETEVEPGQQVNIDVATEEGARVYLRAVDKSVTLANGGTSTALTSRDLLSAFHTADLGTPAEEDSVCYVQDALASAGAGIVSSASVPTCDPWAFFPVRVEDVAFEGAEDDGAVLPSSPEGGDSSGVTLVRKNFPETWIWQWAAGSSGAVSVVETAPHTITSWLLTAWAVHPTGGVGVATVSNSLKVFQSFFVRPSLPYATKRGEILEVPVGVYNYAEVDLSVTVTIEADAADFETFAPTSVQLDIPAGGTASTEFKVKGMGLGSLPLKITGQSTTDSVADAVEKMLLVQAEGLPRVDVMNSFLEISAGQDQTLAVSSTVPAGAVSGSERCMISVTGNLLGQTMENLDRLLTIPTGCGEQNLITLVPNVFVAKYLDAVGEQVPAKAISNTQVGIQKQLTYRLDDGSFSAFGMSDGVGSTWLTAFVIKTFAQARGLDSVYVDTAITNVASGWIEGTQQADGSFAEEGRVIHTEMQGGVSSTLSLTAYVLIALLEDVVSTSASTVADAVISDAMEFVAGEVDAETPLYATLLSAYALNLACKLKAELCPQAISDAAADAITFLEQKKSTSDGDEYWEPEGGAPTGYGVATSSSVEMTAYAVLAYLAADQVGDAFPAVRWLLLQRSSLGAYRSTQDTVVALQALADYATVTHTSDVDLSVAVSQDGEQLLTMDVDSSNLEVLQQEEIPCGSSFTLVASGTGNVIVQRSVSYNVEEEEESPGMLVDVEWVIVDDSMGQEIEGSVCVEAADSSRTGMTMLVVGLFTGYTATAESLATIADHASVDKVEEMDGELQIYLADAPTEELCFSIRATRTVIVLELAPVVVQAYDYYHPEVSGFKVFTAAALNGGVSASSTMVDDGDASTSAATTSTDAPASSSAAAMMPQCLLLGIVARFVAAP